MTRNQAEHQAEHRSEQQVDTGVQDQEIAAFLDAWTTAERTGDVAALQSLLTEDFQGVGPMGFVLPKPAWLERYQGRSLVYEAFALTEARVRRHGATAVVVALQEQRGQVTPPGPPGQRRTQPVPAAARATLVLVQGRDGWRLASAHLSFVAGTPGAPGGPGPHKQD